MPIKVYFEKNPAHILLVHTKWVKFEGGFPGYILFYRTEFDLIPDTVLTYVILPTTKYIC